jgi:hypothetical protein
MATKRAFEVTSKRKKGYPSETKVKRGYRIVHGEKELLEKLGRNDPCPCGSGRLFQKMLPRVGLLLTAAIGITISDSYLKYIRMIYVAALLLQPAFC